MRAPPASTRPSAAGEAGSQSSSSSLGEEGGDLLGGNGAFADHAPAPLAVAEIDDGGCNLAGRHSAIDDDGDPVLQLVPHLFGGRALVGPAEIGGGGGDRDTCGLNDGQGDLRRRHAQSDVARVGGYFQRQAGRGADDDGEGTGPETARKIVELLRQWTGQVLGLVDTFN